ncbi:MAG: phospholipid/cholesterol/gamma-HCH transport system substrate-binding protein [Parvibaculaceae bacterium]|jgi:phospholipid/cholesterol/gamma-HCH transport system substrate-binding protein|nr:outer membrane lipid asymmetry maintenance protein MlaD [Parvibaculaceae bacterium]
MENSFVETLVGAVVIAIAGSFLAYGYSMTDAGNVQGLNITAEFDRVDGLANGADVRLSGIKVGTVTSQSLNPANYSAVVAVSLSSDIKIPVDSSAKITSEGLLGGTYVSLTPGGSEDFLTDGDEIQFTQGSIDLIGLVGQAIFSSQDSK